MLHVNTSSFDGASSAALVSPRRVNAPRNARANAPPSPPSPRPSATLSPRSRAYGIVITRSCKTPYSASEPIVAAATRMKCAVGCKSTAKSVVAACDVDARDGSDASERESTSSSHDTTRSSRAASTARRDISTSRCAALLAPRARRRRRRRALQPRRVDRCYRRC